MVDLSVDLDLAVLLSPITPEQPAGVDLRKSSEYEAVFMLSRTPLTAPCIGRTRERRPRIRTWRRTSGSC